MRLAAFAFLTTLTVATLAAADAGPDIIWDAPGSCPSLQAVHARVGEWLAPEQEVEAPSPRRHARIDAGAVHVVAHIRAEPGGYTLSLQFRSAAGSGSETLRAAQCETLMDVVALKVALAADEEVLSRVTTAPRPRPAELYLRTAGGLSIGVLPAGSAALAGVLGLRWQRLAIELAAHHDLPRDHGYKRAPEVGGRFSSSAGEGRVCLLSRLDRAQVPLCLGLLVGATRAVGYGTPSSRSARQLWVALPFTAGLRWPVHGRWALWSEASVLLSVKRPGYHVRQLGPLQRPDPVGARALFGVEVRFP